MFNLSFEISGNYALRKDSENPCCTAYAEIFRDRPVIGQKYIVVFFCDYDNSEYGENYTIEITADNIAEITFHMNDIENDITEYILIEQ